MRKTRHRSFLLFISGVSLFGWLFWLDLMQTLSRKNKNSNLGKLLDEYAKYQGAVVNITIGMGRKRGRLSSVEASKLVQEAYQANDIQTLKVQMDSNGLTNYEWLDLMLDREFYSFEVKYTKDDPITHEKLFASCYEAMMNEK